MQRQLQDVMHKRYVNGCMINVYCTILTNSLVTGHSDPQREGLGNLSQQLRWTEIFSACGTPFIVYY